MEDVKTMMIKIGLSTDQPSHSSSFSLSFPLILPPLPLHHHPSLSSSSSSSSILRILPPIDADDILINELLPILP